MKRFLFVLCAAVAVTACGDTQTPQTVTGPALSKPGRNAAPAPATAASFMVDGTVMTLTGNITTDVTILIPEGTTLEGNGYTITAVDPDGGHFVGAVVSNAGTVAHVRNVTITASGLTNACDGGANRLRGIMLEGASGSIINATVTGINQGPSGCQEGNAIEVRNAPFDGSHPNTQTVEIAHNTVTDWQKTGIVANGDVAANIHHNHIGASATQANLAANSIQVGFGATGTVENNRVAGNQWLGTSNYAATAILIYAADGLQIRHNNIRGNADIGLYLFGNDGSVDNNRIFDEGADAAGSGYDIGIGNWGADNVVTNNKVRGFQVALDGVTGGKNKVIPGPQKFE